MSDLPEDLRKIDLNDHQNELTSQNGIYFWFDKNTMACVYIGIACSKKGLKGRISRQHLNPRYLESREHKHSVKDDFQLMHPIMRLSSKGIIKKCIDKSTFRKSIGRALKLKPGDETCSYILDNLILKVLESSDKDYLRDLEKKLNQKVQPRFNTSMKLTR